MASFGYAETPGYAPGKTRKEDALMSNDPETNDQASAEQPEVKPVVAAKQEDAMAKEPEAPVQNNGLVRLPRLLWL